MNQLEKDLKFGLCGEKNIYEKLKTISSKKIKKTLNVVKNKIRKQTK